jgi:hypothetical protein
MPEFLRGAKPTPRHKLAAARPHAVVGVTPPQFAVVPKQLSMWDNSDFGCCVTSEEAFAKACYSPEIFISDAEVKRWAQAHGVLNGAEILQVCQWMQSDGFQQDGKVYDDGPAAAVDWTNAEVLQNAISQGAVKIGVAAAQLQTVPGMGRTGWYAQGFHPDSNIDHCTSLCGFGSLTWCAQQLGVTLTGDVPVYMMFTWDSIGIIDVPSLLAITAEAWLRTPTTVIPGPTPTPPPSPTPPPHHWPCRKGTPGGDLLRAAIAFLNQHVLRD